MEIKGLPGLGPAKIDRLATVGITTMEDLAELDLRRPLDIGIGREVLRKAKATARRRLDAAGISYSKAAYGDAPRTGTAAAAKPIATPTTAKGSADGSTPPRKGLLKRLFGRS